MGRFKDTDYLNISMRIKSRENRLMGGEALGRMAECRSADEAASFAAEYLGHVPVPAEGFEAMLASDEKETHRFLRSNIPDGALVDILALRRDYANIKVLVKAELRGISPDGMLTECGTMTADEAKKAYTDRNEKAMEGRFIAAVNAALDVYTKTGDPQKIDLVCDGLCFSEMKKEAEKSAFGFMADYVGMKTDVINILSFIRQKRIGKDADFYASSVLGGGNVFRPSDLRSLYAEDLAAFFARIDRTVYSPVLAGIAPEAPAPTSLEKNADEFICGKIKKLRSVPFGPQVAAGYLLAKEYEAKNVRIVLSGILSGQDRETITERLRLGYE